MNKKKDIDSGGGKVPAPKTSSPTGHEEVGSQVVREQTGGKGAPPTPTRPSPSTNPLPKANTPKPKKKT